MENVTKLPVRFHRQSSVPPREIHEQREPDEEEVWELCAYVNQKTDADDRCQQCPRWEEHEKYGKVMRGCFGMAEEAYKLVLALEARRFPRLPPATRARED